MKNFLVNKRNIFFSAMVFLIVLNLQACYKRTSTSRIGKSAYTSFFVGDGICQYFISSIPISKDLEMDFTYRDNYKDSSKVTINFSFATDSLFQEINSVHLIQSKDTFQLENLQKLYSEKQNNQFLYRYTSTLSAQKFKKFFSTGIDEIILKSENGNFKILTNSSVSKNLKSIHKNLLYNTLQNVK